MSTVAPILHQVYPFFFNLAGRLSPVSIRDQLVRAQMLIDGMIQAGVIGSLNRPLLVVGAGAAGVAVAIRAAQKRVPTWLVDADSDAFNRQAGCSTRWLDPAQYDWPLDHWHSTTYPCTPVAVTLPWTANWSNLVAADWRIQLNGARTAYPWLDVWYSTRVAAAAPSIGWGGRPIGWNVTFSGTFSGAKSFAAVVWATGFGAERCDIGAYSGFPFWATDPFSHPNLGLPGKPRVLLSGSGDGALQDFLRIVTKHHSARDAFDNCGLSADQRRLVERELQSAEDSAQRGYHWGPYPAVGGPHDHAVVNRIHEAHRVQAEGLLGPPGSTNADHVRVRTHVEAMLRDPLPDVTLVHSCTHFSNCYALNRFLVLLIGHYLRREKGRKDLFQPRRRVQKVTGVSHTCHNNWILCHGQEHEIEIIDAPDCDTPPGGGSVTRNAEVVVIRHGIDFATGGPTRSTPVPEIQLPRQMVPYYPPG